MRIPSGKTDQLIFFVALDSTDRVTRKTGLSSFTVYRSRNGGTATLYTTPTVAELSAGNMPGVYSLAIDEDTTIASGSDSEEYCVHITCSTMAPVTRTIELYRRDTTSGRTLDVSTGGEAGLDWANIGSPTTSVNLSGTTVKTATDVETDTQDIQSRLPAALVSGRIDASVGAMASGVVTATAIAADAIGASELAADAATEIATAVWASGTRVLTANTNLNDLSAAGVRSAIGLASANLDTQLDALPTTAEVNAEVDTALADAGVTTVRMAHLDADVSSRLASGSYTAPLDAAGTRSAVGLASANLDTQLDALPTNAELATALTSADDATLAAIAALTAPDNAGIAAIKAKTDSLTFTVSGKVDSNILAVNGTTVTGDGETGTEWGPA